MSHQIQLVLITSHTHLMKSSFLILNVASGGDYDYGAGDNIDKYCHDNEACSNLEDPDRGKD